MTIGEAFLSAFLQVLFEKILSPGVNLFFKLVGANMLFRRIKEWERKLRMIDALLSDAEQKQFHSSAVKLWLQDVQDLAYDLDDTLDEFGTEAQLYELRVKAKERDDEWKEQNSGFLGSASSVVQGILGSSSMVAESFSTLVNCATNLSSKIEDISNRLQDIQTQARDLGLSIRVMQQEISSTEAHCSWRDTTSLVSEPYVYGRDNEKNEIICQLMTDDLSHDNYVVISVLGKGGIGKTTLAQCVYNDEQVEGYFDLKLWVCVSDVFDVKRITTALVNSATPETVNFNNLDQAQKRLKQVLKGEKFLIVLDDIWCDKYDLWIQLQTPFREGVKGSKVIITTRVEKIARMMTKQPSTSNIIFLKGLSDNDCWCLFQHHASEDTDVIEMRDDILRKCNGLPLAAKALGGLLRSTMEKSQRQKILKSTVWSEEGGVLPALRLSYYHLPPSLRRVFSYCSIIPKGNRFLKKDIVLMWMAEGLLREDKGETMEDVGHNYFLDLVSRSLFELSPSQGFFIMHDLIHDLAQWAAGEICCTNDFQSICDRTRHISFSSDVADESLSRLSVASEEFSRLRTFSFFSNFHTFKAPTVQVLILFPKFQYLRLVSLAHMNIDVLPNSIGNLKHLRHLDLSYTKVKNLPESTSNLCNLQTLLLKDCTFLQKVLKDVSFLAKLRHLDIDGTALQELGN